MKDRIYACLIPALTALVFAGACRKKESIQPPLLSNESITVSNASDKDFYPLHTGITFDARIRGDQKDYSFMKAYVMDTVAKRKLAVSEVKADGTMHFAFSPDQPDRYRLQVVAENIMDSNELIEGPVLNIYAGEPPPPDTVLVAASEKSIAVTWSKSSIPNFAAYELYVTRTDTALTLPDGLRGKLIATITDINDTSFTHNDVFFYYRYRYNVRVVSQEQLESLPEFGLTAAGDFAELGRVFEKGYFDDSRSLYYTTLGDDSHNYALVSVDPETHAITTLADLGKDNQFYGLSENDQYFNVVKPTDGGIYEHRLYRFNLDTKLMEERQTFLLPAATIVGVFDDYVIYTGNTPGQPPYRFLGAYRFSDSSNTVIRNMNSPEVTVIDHSTRFFVGSDDPATRDSFYVYNILSAGPELADSGLVQNTLYSKEVYSGQNVVCAGSSLFDGDFNLISTLPENLVYRGISRDGKYAVVSDNSVYDVQAGIKVHQFGDGFTGRSYFSPDNNRLYFATAENLAALGWLPPRLFRYTWRD